MIQSTNEIYFYFILWKISVSPNGIVPLISFLLPDSVTDTIYSTCICLLVSYLMPVVQH